MTLQVNPATPKPPATPSPQPGSCSASDTTSSSTTPMNIPQTPVIETCFSCQEGHFVSNMGKLVDPYLAGPHMQQLPDGRWVCELCCAAMCSRCADVSRHCPDTAVIHSWSRQWSCATKCKKVGAGGWEFCRQALYSTADDSHRVHCQPCRNKMLTRTLADMKEVEAQQAAKKQAESARKVNQGVTGFKTGMAIGGILLNLAGIPTSVNQ